MAKNALPHYEINFQTLCGKARKSNRDLCAKFELLIDEANKFSYRFPDRRVILRLRPRQTRFSFLFPSLLPSLANYCSFSLSVCERRKMKISSLPFTQNFSQGWWKRREQQEDFQVTPPEQKKLNLISSPPFWCTRREKMQTRSLSLRLKKISSLSRTASASLLLLRALYRAT